MIELKHNVRLNVLQYGYFIERENMKNTFKVSEVIDGRVVDTHLDDFKEASKLMLKINKAGGKSSMSRVKPSMTDHSGLSSDSTGERYYNRNNGRLREGALNGRH